MDNPELTEQLKKMTSEKQQLQEWIKTLENEESHKFNQQSWLDELSKWLEKQPMVFKEYDDVLTRKMIERIEVVDAETIKVKI